MSYEQNQVQNQGQPESTEGETTPQFTGRMVNIAPTREGQQHMANLFAEQHLTSQQIVDRATALAEKIETDWLDGLLAQLQSEDGYEVLKLIKAGLEALVGQENARIASMQAGLKLLAQVEVFPKSRLRRPFVTGK